MKRESMINVKLVASRSSMAEASYHESQPDTRWNRHIPS